MTETLRVTPMGQRARAMLRRTGSTVMEKLGSIFPDSVPERHYAPFVTQQQLDEYKKNLERNQ